ncbi:MAG: selenide, water dikinase SelD [Marinilabiliales bacterium]|nr:MAG: selenide, water dikinase SelD [Marinilabiliales bacterium]
MTDYKLTQFSPGAGCGCKIAPNILESILSSAIQNLDDRNLLVGNSSKDDAAVYDIGNNSAIISTTDFFTPIVDDPFDFGRIAATNAISDIYAMGGKPILAIAILGWPLDKLPANIATEVISGARQVCKNAGISLAGGHSIDIADPIFGLAVTGIVNKEGLKQNNTAQSNCRILLTKPLGIGILTTAEKKQILDTEDNGVSVDWMCKLNTAGENLAKLNSVKAMTDVTGFGLLGHLLEMCQGSNVSAEINFDKIPKLNNVNNYIEKKCFPGGTFRNWKSYGNFVDEISEEQKMLLCDPQTSGGLLIAVEENHLEEVMSICKKYNTPAFEIGIFKEYKKDKPYIKVI